LRFKHTVLLSKDFHLCNAISFLGIVASDSKNVIKNGKNVIKTGKNVIKTDKNVRVTIFLTILILILVSETLSNQQITTDRNFIKNVKNTIKAGKIVVNVLQNNC
jgi:hypothetical protein